MRLFHFTSEERFIKIEALDKIEATWPQVLSPELPTRMVWLTTEPDRSRQGWASNHPSEIRITVDVPDAELMAWREAVPWNVVSSFEVVARGSNGDPGDWYIVHRDIPRDEWVNVDHLGDPPPPTITRFF